MHKILEKVLTQQDLKFFLDIFDKLPHYFTQGMEKLSLPLDNEEFISYVDAIIKNKIQIDSPYKIVGDNFYRHENSYFPHCDAIEKNSWLNIVIPLCIEESYGQQTFIVFDQTWTGKNATWVGNFNINGDFVSNKKIHIPPYQGEYFNNGTGKDLPLNIWEKIDQKHFDRKYFFSMSGKIYNWNPGDIIVFDSNHIHATGKMQCNKKTGISIRIVRS